MSDKSYAVSQNPLPRREATSNHPLSSGWTLYNPQDLADKLNLPLGKVEKALEETGFIKAVRIREELIKWKTRLLEEQKNIANERKELQEKLKKINQRESVIKDDLVNIRNILRIPRSQGQEGIDSCIYESIVDMAVTLNRKTSTPSEDAKEKKTSN